MGMNGDLVRAYLKLARARSRGAGCTLSAQDVHALFVLDTAIEDAVANIIEDEGYCPECVCKRCTCPAEEG